MKFRDLKKRKEFCYVCPGMQFIPGIFHSLTHLILRKNNHDYIMILVTDNKSILKKARKYSRVRSRV